MTSADLETSHPRVDFTIVFIWCQSSVAPRRCRESTIEALQPRQAGRVKTPTAAHVTRHTEKADNDSVMDRSVPVI